MNVDGGLLMSAIKSSKEAPLSNMDPTSDLLYRAVRSLNDADAATSYSEVKRRLVRPIFRVRTARAGYVPSPFLEVADLEHSAFEAVFGQLRRYDARGSLEAYSQGAITGAITRFIAGLGYGPREPERTELPRSISDSVFGREIGDRPDMRAADALKQVEDRDHLAPVRAGLDPIELAILTETVGHQILDAEAARRHGISRMTVHRTRLRALEKARKILINREKGGK
jgi:RNA polymerase sigma factor (sigma-70 family)